MDRGEAIKIIKGFEFGQGGCFGTEATPSKSSAPPEIHPKIPVQLGRTFAHNIDGNNRSKHHFWEPDTFLDELPNDPGVYFIILKESAVDKTSEIILNVKINNTMISRPALMNPYCDGELEYYVFSDVQNKVIVQSLPVQYASNYPDASRQKAELISKNSFKNRIIKIGKARAKNDISPRRPNGIRRRIKTYENMQYPITRYIFGTEIFKSVELFFVPTRDNTEADELETLLIETYENEYQTNPPWEQ